MGDRARLLLADLEPLAVFLCGPRWQTALARRINRSPRLVRRWVAGDRPIDLDQLAERRPAAAQPGARVSIVDPPCAVHGANTARAARAGDRPPGSSGSRAAGSRLAHARLVQLPLYLAVTLVGRADA